MTRYLVIDRDRGVFLGTYLNFILFAINKGYDIVKATSFDSEEDAQNFVEKMIDTDKLDYFIAPIESNDKYIYVVDIVKAGYGDYVHYMIDSIPTISDSMH